MKRAMTYVWLHVAGAIFWWWLMLPKTFGKSIVMLVSVSLAVVLFRLYVLPQYRRNSWSYEDRPAAMLLHTFDREYREPLPEWKPERTAEERNTVADIHGTG